MLRVSPDLQEPVVPMCFMRVRPIGVMQMLDQGEQDDKLIAVHADDPEFRGFSDISQLPPHRLAEIKRCVQLLSRRGQQRAAARLVVVTARQQLPGVCANEAAAGRVCWVTFSLLW